MKIVGGRVAGGAAIAYAMVQWSKMGHWGATREQAEEPLPGDEIVGHARYRTTRAITIGAPVEQVWSWVVQIGQDRGGMYSYDWLENLFGLHMHSADRIVPSLQQLRVGDVIRMVPEGTQPELKFVVARVEPPYLLVLGPGGSRADASRTGLPYPCWTFRLAPTGDGRSRLVVRFQSDFKPTLTGWLMNRYALAPVHFLMERKMMLGIKNRVERAANCEGSRSPGHRETP